MQSNYPAFQAPGFFAALFDFSFRSFVTEKIIPVLYALWLIAVALFALGVVVAGFEAGSGPDGNPALGILALLIGAPLILLFGAIYGRVVLEAVIVLFRIADYTKVIADQGRTRMG